jgi:hypothetical protein
MCNCNNNEFELLPELEVILNTRGNHDCKKRHIPYRNSNRVNEYETSGLPDKNVSVTSSVKIMPPINCQTAAVNIIPKHLDPKLIGCINTIVPGVNTAYLFDTTVHANPGQIWVRLLNVDPNTLLKTLYPKVRLTIELWRFITMPAGNQNSVLLPLRKYLESKGNRYTVSILTSFSGKNFIEKLANTSLDKLAGSVGAPDMYHSLYWHVYATFPDDIKTHFRRVQWTNVDKFDFNKSDVLPYQDKLIETLAFDILESWLPSSSIRYTEVTFAGHTDSRGTEAYNVELGKKRATTAAAALNAKISKIAKANGWDESKIKLKYNIISFGESRPISIKPPVNYALNRRVEITLKFINTPIPEPLDLDDVIKRSTSIIKRNTSLEKETRSRILCVLTKMQNTNTDDRYIIGSYVQQLKMSPFPKENEWPRLRFHFTNSSFFGVKLRDADILKQLVNIDNQINEGIAQLSRIKDYDAGIPFLGNAATNQTILNTLKWVSQRAKDKNSIYSCGY